MGPNMAPQTVTVPKSIIAIAMTQMSLICVLLSDDDMSKGEVFSILTLVMSKKYNWL